MQAHDKVEYMLKIAESYLQGHPDKVCDQIADAILDEFLRRDRDTRANIEVFGGNGAIMVSGTVKSRADFDVGEVVKQTYKEIGYEDQIEPFVHLGEFETEELPLSKGASTDQVVCNGYATRATVEILPLPLVMARTLAKRIDEARQHNHSMQWLKEDGKVLITLDKRQVKSVSILCQHKEEVKVQEVVNGMLEEIIKPVIGSIEDVKLLVNPAGPFTHGGLAYKAGISGRQIASDLYGGLIPHGNMTLSGKDPQNPARAGAYMARHIAKSMVASGKASQCLVKIAYTVGRIDPIVFQVSGDNGEDLTELAKQNFKLTINEIVDRFNLKKPIYRRISTHGQVGRNDVEWELPSEIK